MKASVKNFGETPWDGRLRACGFYFPNAQDHAIDPATTVFFNEVVEVASLPPGAAVEVLPERSIQSLAVVPGSIAPVACAKLSCNGHVHLILEDRSGVQLPPPNTHISISWAKSGETKDIVIKDEGSRDAGCANSIR